MQISLRTTQIILISTLVCTVFVPNKLSAASTTVTAVVAPVRILTIDTQGNILRVQSNTPENVTPAGVHSNGTAATVLSQYTLRQYKLILPTLRHSYGIVYERPSKVQLRISEYLAHYLASVSYQN